MIFYFKQCYMQCLLFTHWQRRCLRPWNSLLLAWWAANPRSPDTRPASFSCCAASQAAAGSSSLGCRTARIPSQIPELLPPGEKKKVSEEWLESWNNNCDVQIWYIRRKTSLNILRPFTYGRKVVCCYLFELKALYRVFNRLWNSLN